MRKEKDQVSELPSEYTTIIVREEMTADDSMIIARSEDWNAMETKNYELYEGTKEGPREFVTLDSPFCYKLPKEALGYNALVSFNLPRHWGNTGFNTIGTGINITKSIFSSGGVLKYGPLVETGLTENVMFSVVLSYIRIVREGVERLDTFIKKHGTAEGFGIGFVDIQETRYLEMAYEHR